MAQTPAPQPTAPALPRWLVPVSIAGLVGYLAVLLWSEGSGMSAASTVLRLDLVAMVLGLSLLNYALRYRRWERYLQHLGHSPPRARQVLIYVAGFALTVSPGKAGESVRSLYLLRAGVPVSASLAALFVERVLDMLAVALLALLLALAAGGEEHGILVLGGVGATLVVVALLGWRGMPRWLRGRSAARGRGRTGLAAVGVTLPAAIAATALCRLATLWFAVVLGLGAMLLLHQRRWDVRA